MTDRSTLAHPRTTAHPTTPCTTHQHWEGPLS
jgi:hypothetical protein